MRCAPAKPIEVALSPGFVADYECWNRSVRPPRGLRGLLGRATSLEMAVVAGEATVVASLIEAGADVDPNARIRHVDQTSAHAAVGAIELTLLSTAPRTKWQAFYDEIVASYSEVLRRLAAAGNEIEASRMKDPRVEALLEEIRRTAR